MDTTAYYALLMPIYVGLIGLEAAVARARGRPVLSFGVGFGNLSAGLGALFVGLFVGPALYALYGWALARFALFHWTSDSLWIWIVGLLMADFAHYWQHRVDHRVAPLWAMHGVHHQSTEVNLTLAMRHTWGSDFYSFPFYAALPLLGVPANVFFLSTVVMSVHAMATHSSELRFPSFGVLVTPQSHRLHHAREACYVDRNYGGMFSIWDKLFGTHVEELAGTPPTFGVARGYGTHDGAMCQWLQGRDFFERWLQLPGWRERWRRLLAPPEALPPASARWAPPPSGDAIATRTKIYVALQFIVTAVLALIVLDDRDRHGWPLKIGLTLFVLLSLFSLGGLLDRRRHARRMEVGRMVLALVALPALLWTGLTSG